MEFSSKRTYRNDLDEKMALYARMAIPEYFIHDPERRYLSSPLLGFRLVEGQYVEIAPDADGRVHSEVLNLDFALLDEGLAIYDPQSEQWLQTLAEKEAAARQKAEAEAEKAEAEAEKAEAENAQLRAARQKAEAENARLREELARLKAQM